MPTVREILNTWELANPMIYIDNGEITRVFIDSMKLRTNAPNLLDKQVVEMYSCSGKTIPLLKISI